jgi:hypothetical protein
MLRFRNVAKSARAWVWPNLITGLLCLPAQSLIAANCAIVHRPAFSEADTAFLAGDFSKAEELYKTALASHPGQPDLAIGLVHSLLRQQRVLDAANEVQSLIGDTSASARLLTLRAEVELRQGEPWKAADTAVASAKLDPCNARTLLVLARLAALNSRLATASKLLVTAHQMDPEDQEIRAEWIETLPANERIQQLEDYLASPRGDDSETLDSRRSELEELKKWAEEPRAACSMVSKTSTTTLPFTALRSFLGDATFPSVDVHVNDHRLRLSIDTSYNARLPIDGVSGLLILRSTAEHLGLKPLFQNQVPGIGPQGPRDGYVAYADSISIGDLEFHNCAVQVMDGVFWSDADGAMSLNLLSDFLVTLDYPNHKLIVGPLPEPPANGPSNGPAERYIAPEMKDYIPVYRADTDLFLTVMVNKKYPMLFLINTAMGSSALSAEASHEVADGHMDSKYEVRNTSGKVDTRFSGGDVNLAFAGLTKDITHIGSFDTARFTMDAGMDISGFLGNETLRDVTIHFDYRDGLVKLDFDSKHPGVR